MKSYLDDAMNRFVLAILALLAGLVTQTAPAHARLSAGSGAEVAAQMPGAAQTVVQASRSGCRPQIARIGRSNPNPCAALQRAPAPATVVIKSDRARE